MDICLKRCQRGQLKGHFDGRPRNRLNANAALGFCLGPLRVAIAIVFFGLTSSRADPDPDRLWRLVSEQCVPDQQEHSNPAPCESIELSEGIDRGFALLKDNDLSKPHAFLLIPTRHMAGIESPELHDRDAPNYFADAWAARSHVAALVGSPVQWDMVGLAVNSAEDRTQLQLHIHIDCIRPEIRDAIRKNEAVLGSQWSELNLPAPDHPYMMMKLSVGTLEGSNPFQLLAEGIAGAKDHMELQTLVVVGAVFKDKGLGFYLLSSRHRKNVPAHGEDLLDPNCRVAHEVHFDAAVKTE